MNKTSAILAVVTDEVGHSAAVQRAVELARLSGGTLHLCSFIYDSLIDAERPRPHVARLACLELLREQEQRLYRLAAELAHPQFNIECEVLWAPVMHEAIITKALAVAADCVVKDVRRESILRRMLFTPLDWKLIRLLPCDLMLVGADAAPHPERLLAAIDVLAESPEREDGLNAQILQSTRWLGELTGARMDLVSVMPWFPLSGRGIHSGAQYEEQVRKHHEAFRTFSERLQVPSDHCHRPLGIPAEAIAKIAEQLSSDIAVVGNYYRNGWERLLLGSTAETLLQQLRCDLLVVKPRDFAVVERQHVDIDAMRRRVALEQPADRVPEVS